MKLNLLIVLAKNLKHCVSRHYPLRKTNTQQQFVVTLPTHYHSKISSVYNGNYINLMTVKSFVN